MHWRNREKQNDQEYHETASFIHPAEFKNFLFLFFFLFFFFAFDKVTSSLSMLLVALFFLVEKRSNSRLQIFFKIGGLKNFALFTENTCVGDSF